MKDNCITSTKKILELLGIKHTQRFIENNILSHPDHPSLLCVSDTLKKYNIENAAVKVEKNKLSELPTPCIAQLKGKGTTWFCVLKNIVNGEAAYFDEDLKLKSLGLDAFKEIWTGICLLVEKNEKSIEPGFFERKKARQSVYVLFSLTVISLMIWSLVHLLDFYNSYDSKDTWIFTLFITLKLLGLITATGLLWYEVDQYNPVIQNFCSGGKKINCEAVLGSKYAKILNGKLSLSILAFSYFLSTTIGLFSFGLSQILFALSAFTLPLVILSVYYQAFVLKNWCKFCLIVVGVLIGESGVAFFHGFNFTFFDAEMLPSLSLTFLLSISGWVLLKPFLQKNKEARTYKRGLSKIKNNPVVFDSLLAKSNSIKTNPENIGLMFSNERAKCKVIKVCNPYCGPCANAHPALDELYNSGLIALQIIFTATTDEKDLRSKPVAHFLAIEEHLGKTKTLESLDSWYNAKTKDYAEFSKNYPMNGELTAQKTKIEKMNQWCENEKITHTPTIFINGHELPKEYSVNDLKEVLMS